MTENGRTFPPLVEPDGTVRAGGLNLGIVRDDGALVVPDRYRRRCQARGTEDVPVDLVALVEAVIEHLRERT